MTTQAQTASPDAVERIKSLIEITESLSNIFVEENHLLSTQRSAAIAPLQEEKARLAAAYAQAIRDIAASRSIVDGTDAGLLAKLRSITKTFEQRAADQHALLEGVRQAAEGVVKAVAEEAASTRAQISYGDDASPAELAPIILDESA